MLGRRWPWPAACSRAGAGGLSGRPLLAVALVRTHLILDRWGLSGRHSAALLEAGDLLFRGVRVRRSPGIILCILPVRSEEHTSELQSRGHLVCRLLLEKKKKRLTRD